MVADGRGCVVIENVVPEIDCGRFPIKRIVREKVIGIADIFSDRDHLKTWHSIVPRVKKRLKRETGFDSFV
jgi:Alpha-1,4-glucan:maltose-1-phosphate maltosyltransferase, domain N/S